MIARVIIPLFEAQTNRRYAVLGNLLSPRIGVPKFRIHFLKTATPNDYESAQAIRDDISADGFSKLAKERFTHPTLAEQFSQLADRDYDVKQLAQKWTHLKLLREVSCLDAVHEEVELPSLIMPNDMRLMVPWDRLEFIVNYVRQKPGTFYGLQFTDDVDKSFVNVDGFLHEGFNCQFEGPMIIMPEAANILMNAPDDLPKGFYTYSDRIIAKSRWTILNDFI